MKRLLCAATLLAVSVVSDRAFADSKSEAKEHVARATTLHHDGRYDEALDELRIAYALDPEPDILYAIAQVHVKLGQCPQAITFYERFLASDPKPGPAGAARQAIEICKTSSPNTIPPHVAPRPEPTKPEPTKPEPVKPEPTKPEPAKPEPTNLGVSPVPAPLDEQPPWYLQDKVADGLVIGGALSALVGVIAYSDARSDIAQAKLQTSYPQQAALVDSGSLDRTLAVVFGVGAVGLIAGGVGHYLWNEHDHRRMGIVPTQTGGVVTWTGDF